ncbi:nucleotidyltransferase domain-containing protein [Nocardia terpenica]|uniref:nucleotidyltransferase domain-containing protein n=1 Tax=Nocardia terpenica TaxID=455432 RepID=UPI002FE1F9BA
MSSEEIARHLVRERFPQARAAWLGGSSVTGNTTATSDLDVTVLLAGPPAPYRESLHHGDRPVELFVQTEETLEFFQAGERARRRPTTLRSLTAI